jgi:hypothetical protein
MTCFEAVPATRVEGGSQNPVDSNQNKTFAFLLTTALNFLLFKQSKQFFKRF